MSTIQPITLPKWGLEMSEGTIVAWRVDEGSAVETGMELVDIETEKIVNTLDAERPGVLRRRLARVGETLPIGALIAVVAPAEIPNSEIAQFVTRFQPLKATPAERESEADAAAPPTPARLSDEELRDRNETVHASPMARRLANKLGIDLTGLAGSGRGGRISQEDVEAIAGTSGNAEPAAPILAEPSAAPVAAVAGPAARKLAREMGVDLDSVTATGVKGRVSKEDVRASATPSGVAANIEFEDVEFTPLRRSIAQALVQAKQTIPHFYLTADIPVDDVLTFRARLNARAAAPVKISLNDFIVKASALALAENPDVNVHVLETGVRRFKQSHVAIAVAIEGGLIAPVLRDAATKDIQTISREAAALAERARTRTLMRNDLADATFTVSNLGMFGIRQFDAIINPPQGAILAVGGMRRQPVETEAGGIAFRSVLTVSLSCDHRAIDGAAGARFLVSLRRLMEDPISLLL